MKLIRKPYQLLFITSIVLVLLSFFKLNESQSIDFHLHDTYFVMDSKFMLWAFAVFTFIVWALYRLANKKLYSASLTWTHIATTLLPLVLFTFVLCFGHNFSNSKPLSHYDFSNWNVFDTSHSNNTIIGIAFLVFLFSQLIFMLNLSLGLFKAKTN